MSDTSSDSGSSDSEESLSSLSSKEDVKEDVQEDVQEDVFKKPHKGYICDRCGYTTRLSKSFISHVTRKTPCYVIKDYSYGVQKARELYEKKSKIILKMLESLEEDKEVDLNKMAKYFRR